mmetsp:Transcript_104256/g.238719  ORF Transcript_104256/g.238719 Transcript_104256/m.238719 type:complete len:623 (-) Transcript_104256:655-2523(-)
MAPGSVRTAGRRRAQASQARRGVLWTMVQMPKKARVEPGGRCPVVVPVMDDIASAAHILQSVGSSRQKFHMNLPGGKGRDDRVELCKPVHPFQLKWQVMTIVADVDQPPPPMGKKGGKGRRAKQPQAQVEQAPEFQAQWCNAWTQWRNPIGFACSMGTKGDLGHLLVYFTGQGSGQGNTISIEGTTVLPTALAEDGSATNGFAAAMLLASLRPDKKQAVSVDVALDGTVRNLDMMDLVMLPDPGLCLDDLRRVEKLRNVVSGAFGRSGRGDGVEQELQAEKEFEGLFGDLRRAAEEERLRLLRTTAHIHEQAEIREALDDLLTHLGHKEPKNALPDMHWEGDPDDGDEEILVTLAYDDTEHNSRFELLRGLSFSEQFESAWALVGQQVEVRRRLGTARSVVKSSSDLAVKKGEAVKVALNAARKSLGEGDVPGEIMHRGTAEVAEHECIMAMQSATSSLHTLRAAASEYYDEMRQVADQQVYLAEQAHKRAVQAASRASAMLKAPLQPDVVEADVGQGAGPPRRAPPAKAGQKPEVDLATIELTVEQEAARQFLVMKAVELLRESGDRVTSAKLAMDLRKVAPEETKILTKANMAWVRLLVHGSPVLMHDPGPPAAILLRDP